MTLDIALLLLLASAAPSPADSTHCVDAATFLRADRGMTAIVEADTFDDWRTQKRVPGCRITSAGVTRSTIQREAVLFYERVRATGWTRTPDPRDSPNEASLRFRKGSSDCLFNVNAQALLLTDAESRVLEAVVPKSGETRYHVFVMCMPAGPASPVPPAGIGF